MKALLGEPFLGAGGNWEASSFSWAPCELRCSSSMAV